MVEDQAFENDPQPFRSYARYLKQRFGQRTHRISLDGGFGCPHRQGGRGPGGCIYCNPAGSGQGAFDQGIPVAEQMRRGIDRMSARGVRSYLAYFQAFCGTDAPLEDLRRLYREALAHPGVRGLIVGTRPDMADDPVLALLADLGREKAMEGTFEVWLELGLQSALDRTLTQINRGHDVACFDEAVLRAAGHGLIPAAHVILGLPGEGMEESLITADHLSRLPVRGVKLHQLYVERGTELARHYRSGAFQPLTPETYLEQAIGFIRHLRRDIVILRLAGKARMENLIAPTWAGESRSWPQRISREMNERGVSQGDQCLAQEP